MVDGGTCNFGLINVNVFDFAKIICEVNSRLVDSVEKVDV